MLAFSCRVCRARLFFGNSVCVTCGTAVAYLRPERALVPVDDGRHVDHGGAVWHVCAHLGQIGCTWLTPVEGGLCDACALTRTRPDDEDAVGQAQWADAEAAKRHLLADLDSVGLRVLGKDPATGGDPDEGLAFDLLTSHGERVVTGHENGLVTLDLAESDDAHREKVRSRLAEPYRTLLGHFRHEVGHYYEWQMVRGDEAIARCREVFGDERADYGEALERHYSEGAPEGWEASYVSTYATMHPFEDFAETFAHYLHIWDTIETAREFGLATVASPGDFASFRDVVGGVWMPLSVALNQINRAMGKDDLYPFVLPDPVLDKLDLVASLVAAART